MQERKRNSNLCIFYMIFQEIHSISRVVSLYGWKNYDTRISNRVVSFRFKVIKSSFQLESHIAIEKLPLEDEQL